MTEAIVLALGPNSNFSTDDILRAQPPLLSCRMTGGGCDTSGNWDHTLANGQMVHNTAHNLPPTIDRYTFGGQAGAPTAAQPQPSGHWEHHQQLGPSGSFDFGGGDGNVTGTRMVEIRCSDPGACVQASANAPNKELDFDAIGTFQHLGTGQSAPAFLISNPNVVVDSKKGVTYHWFQVNVDDLGEPGGNNTGTMDPTQCPARGFGENSAGPYTNPTTGVTTILPFAPVGNCNCPDFYRIKIYNGVSADNVKLLPDGRIDPNSLDKTTVIYEVFGYIDGGNLQLHPPTGQ